MEVFQEGWQDVTISEYLDLQEISKNSSGLLNRSLETLCYLSDSDEWEEEESGVILKEYLKHSWLKSPPINPTVQTVGDRILKPLSKLTLAEWIDLDSAIVNNELTKIPAIVYRSWKKDEWGNIEYEPYKYSINERAVEYEITPITTLVGVITEAIEYRSKVHSSFSDLFEQYEDENLTEEETQQLSDAEIKTIQEDIKKDNEKKLFAWQRLLDDMSGGDWSVIPSVLDLPHTFVFNMRLSRKIYGD